MSDAALSLRTTMQRGRLSRSAVSWGAIVAGAIAAAAFSFALFALGAGIGLASISPWGGGPSAATFGVLTGAWLIAIELFALGLGGYLAGRLRTRWSGVHTDEAFFRDTAHGLLVWALASVIGVALVHVRNHNGRRQGGADRSGGRPGRRRRRGAGDGGGIQRLDGIFHRLSLPDGSCGRD